MFTGDRGNYATYIFDKPSDDPAVDERIHDRFMQTVAEPSYCSRLMIFNEGRWICQVKTISETIRFPRDIIRSVRERLSGNIKFCAASIIGLLIIGSCSATGTNIMADDPQKKDNVAVHPIGDVVREHTEELMSIPGVVGVGEGLCNNTPCIKVYVNKSTPELDKKIPAVLEGYKVSKEVTGSIRAHPDD
jgi:hypothetical protein